MPSDETILDIGCGIGQTLVALDCADRRRIGVDIDSEAIEYGRRHFPDIEFVVADAKSIPIASKSVDLIVTRVSLPYTNIPLVLSEAKRLLRKNGRMWMTVHSLNMAKKLLRAAIYKRDVKDILHKVYVLLNGLLFRLTGRLMPFVDNTYESWQGVEFLAKYLERRGFSVSIGRQNGIDFIEATFQCDIDGSAANSRC